MSDLYKVGMGSNVYVARSPLSTYQVLEGIHYPELMSRDRITTAIATLRQLLLSARMDVDEFGNERWNPLAAIVPEGARVLLKPNWVRDPVPSHDDGQSLVTHTHVIDAILAYLSKVPDCRVIIGDAPIQGCNFDRLLQLNGIPEMLARRAGQFRSLKVVDFRKTVLNSRSVHGRTCRSSRADDLYVLFDLGSKSYLEEITRKDTHFRVTMYNPDYLARTHAPGRHQYLIAKEVLEADVVINLPKLKTHKKACLTGGLKNMVGINGHKEYLPHHRMGGTANGGDCYPGKSWSKALAERILDLGNRTERLECMRLASLMATGLVHLAMLAGADDNLDGSWYGNDTVWRMCLDLQRILYYGTLEGNLATSPQRRVITVTDAIIAGQGDGPLRPTPCTIGLMTMSESTAAADYVHSFLMGLDPQKIPLVRNAFSCDPWPLANGSMQAISVFLGEERMTPEELAAQVGIRAMPPRGWYGHCEWTKRTT
jgi:uncharacterized protein (DUF362 family)